MTADMTVEKKDEASRPDSRSPRPLQAAIVLSALYLLARIIGLVQFGIIAQKLDPNARDAYTAAFRIPEFVNYMIAGGALSSTFIPIFTELLQKGREKEAWRFFSSLVTLASVALLFLILGSVALASPLMLMFNTGLAERPEVFRLAVAMTQVMLPAQFFFYIGGVIVGVLNSNKRFSASGWTGAVYNLGAIVVALCLLPWLGPIAFAWGILIGAGIGNFLIPLWAALTGPAHQRIHFTPNFDWRHPALKRFFLNTLPIMLGVSFPVMDTIVVGWFASYLQEGTMFNLGLGYRVMIAGQVIIAQAASVAAFPYMASNSAAQDWVKFSEFIRTGLRRLLFVAVPLSILMILLAQPLINILFRADAFTQADANETAILFAFYCIGIFAWAGQQFVARGFYALQDTLTPTVIGSGLTILFILVSWIAVSLDGARGLAMATSIGATAHFTCILTALDTKMRRRRYRAPLRLDSITRTLLQTTVACIPMAIIGLIANSMAIGFLADDKIGDFMRLVWVGVVACATFALMAQLFSIPEWHWLKGKFLRRTKK